MTGPTTPKGELRRDAFVAAARKLFIERGIEGLQVNDVIRLSGGSLSTLYAYFPGKKDLLRAVAMHGGFQAPLSALKPDNDDQPLREVLVTAALEYAGRALEPQNLCTMRALIACATSHPDIAHEALLGRREAFLDEVSRYLERQQTRGRLTFDNLRAAATQYQSLVCGPWMVSALYGAMQFTTPDYLRASVDDAVQTFLRRYAVCSGSHGACEFCGAGRSGHGFAE